MIEETSSSAALRRCRERAAIAREMAQDLSDNPTLKSSVAINAALLSSAPRKLAKRAQVPKVTVHRHGYQDILNKVGEQRLPRIYRAPDDKGRLIHHLSSSTGSITATKQTSVSQTAALGLVKARQPGESTVSGKAAITSKSKAGKRSTRRSAPPKQDAGIKSGLLNGTQQQPEAPPSSPDHGTTQYDGITTPTRQPSLIQPSCMKVKSARRLRKPSASQRSASMKVPPPQNPKVSAQGGSNTNAPSKMPVPPAAAAQAAKTIVDSYRKRRYTSAIKRNRLVQHQQ